MPVAVPMTEVPEYLSKKDWSDILNLIQNPVDSSLDAQDSSIHRIQSIKKRPARNQRNTSRHIKYRTINPIDGKMRLSWNFFKHQHTIGPD